MKPILLYFFQVLIASGLLYSYYHFALRNKKFHRYNRFYLLLSIVISAVIPFLNIPLYFSENKNESSLVFETLQIISASPVESSEPIAVPAQVPAGNWFTGSNIFYVLYFIIGSLFVTRILISLDRIRQIIKKHPAEKFNGITFINTDEPGTPFSFFRWLFWNRKIELQSEKGEQIFRHEVFHIHQKHTWDIIFIELVTVVLWINPFFYLIKKELKAIHEFLADEFAIKENRNWQYVELLLMQALNTNSRLVNPFFHNQIKRRITMITLSKKPSHQYLRKLMVLPIAAIIIFLFAFRYENKKDKLHGSENIVLVHPPKYLHTQDTVKPKPDTIVWIKDMPKPKKKSPTAAELKSWQDAKIYGIWIDGKRVSNSELNKYTPDDFSLFYSSKLYKNAVNYGKHYYEICLYTRKYYEERIVGANMKPGEFVKEILLTDTVPQQPLIVINGKSMPGLSFNDLERILSPRDIETITVLKDPGSIAKYGENGKNGVFEINAKKLTPNKYENIEKIIVDEKPSQTPDNKVFVKVEIEPAFKGGQKAWKDFLMKNLDASVPVDSGAPEGAYTVILQFIVNKDGTIEDLKTLTKHGFGMEGECIRLMKLSPKWEPAIQNGRIVKAYKKQPITFVISERVN